MNSEVRLCMVFMFFSLCFYFSTVLWIVNTVIMYAYNHTCPSVTGTKIKETFTELYYSAFYFKRRFLVIRMYIKNK